MAKSQRTKAGTASPYRRRKPMVRSELLQRLTQVGGDELASFAAWVLDNAPKHQLKIEWGDAGPKLKYVHELHPDKSFKFGQLEATGVFGQRKGIFGAGVGKNKEKINGLHEAGQEYLRTVAALTNAKVKTLTSPRGHIFNAVVVGDRLRDWPQLATLAPRKRQWFAAIDTAIRKIRERLEAGGGNGGRGQKGGNGGQGRVLDSVTRTAIENRAMDMAIDHYKRAGYEVRDTSRKQSYDLECRHGSETFRVEVKGTQSDGKTVQLSSREVDNARIQDIRTDLFVVGMIEVTKTPNGPRASGGKVVCHIKCWVPDDDDLTATEFRYQVPAKLAE